MSLTNTKVQPAKVSLCPMCSGQGYILISRGDNSDAITCLHCDGTGLITEKELETTVPTRRS